MALPGTASRPSLVSFVESASSKSARTVGFSLIPITRIVWKCGPEYLGFFQLITNLVELEYARIHPVSRMATRKIVLRQLKPANFFLHGQVETAGNRAER